jgi:UDP-glucose 4-epimerase
MKKLLITGSAGFIGRTLARYFTGRGYQVYGIDRTHSENAPLIDLAEYVQSELPSPLFGEVLKRWKPNAILHCAGRASVSGAMQDPLSDFQDGPALTYSLLDSVRELDPDCAFILLSSAAVYGNPPSLPVSEKSIPNPVSSYGYHKLQSEISCREYADLWGMRTASARIFSAYGAGLRRQVMWDITHKALTQPDVRLQGTGQESRDFIHVQDIARGLEVIVEDAPLNGEVYNLASGRETPIAYLAELILNRLGSSITPVFSGELPPGTPKQWCADIGQIQTLGFVPQVELKQGVESFVDWCRHEISGV